MDLTGLLDTLQQMMRGYYSTLSTKINTVLTGVRAHVVDVGNPHRVDKVQVGLGLVQNLPVATTEEAQTGLSNMAYMTPARTAKAIAAQVGDSTVSHIGDDNNPHGVTKAQVGLGGVQNYSIATQGDAETGSVTNKYMTPQRTAQAITAQVGNTVGTHVSDTTNPHQVTKAQVGLSLVQNYGVASEPEVTEGVATNKYMTPAGTHSAFNQYGLGVVESPTMPNADAATASGLYELPVDQGGPTDGAFGGIFHNQDHPDASSQILVSRQVADNPELYFRAVRATILQPWRKVWHDGNFDPTSLLAADGKAADSNLLDGLDSTKFLRSDIAQEFTGGTLAITGDGAGIRLSEGSDNAGVRFNYPTGDLGELEIYTGDNGTEMVVFNAYSTSGATFNLLTLARTGPSYNTHALWHEGNFDPASKAAVDHAHAWGEITGKPATYSPSAHGHGWAEITDKPAAFPPTDHNHSWTEISGKPTSFPPDPHGHSYLPLSGGTITGIQRIRNGSPTLHFQDTDGYGAFLHNNANLLYILRSTAADSTSWDNGPNGRHPMTLNLSTGTVTFSGDNGGYSDARLKKDIITLNGALAAVLKMRGVNYTWIKNGHASLGFVAQEMLDVAPDLVGIDNDGYYYIKYDRVSAYLVEAMKDVCGTLESQSQTIDDLQTRLDHQQRQLEVLTRQLHWVTASNGKIG